MFPMSTRTSNPQPLPHSVLRIALCFVLACPLLPRLAHAQEVQKTPNELDTAIADVKSGDVSPRDVEVIARTGAGQAIPALEVQFARTTDLDTKMKIAGGLVRLGDKNNTYWDFLLKQATLAVDSDLPDPFRDSQGNATGRQLSPEFKTWVQTHDVDLSTAVESWTYDLPGKVLLLAETGDPRGIPLLRRALQSHNYQIAAWAAKGLAKIQDKESIPLIVAAVQRAPPEHKSHIAESLVYFDDAQAQGAVDTYIPKDKATLAREERARGRGVFGW
jgi:PBS lyase HEAT-like repeat